MIHRLPIPLTRVRGGSTNLIKLACHRFAIGLPPPRFEVRGSRELRRVQGKKEQGLSRDCARRVEAHRDLKEDNQSLSPGKIGRLVGLDESFSAARAALFIHLVRCLLDALVKAGHGKVFAVESV